MKKLKITACICSCILAISLIPINLFLCEIPLFLPLIVSSAAIILLCSILKGKYSKKTKIIFSVLIIICVTFSLFGSFCNPFWNSLLLRVNANYKCIGYDKPVAANDAVKDMDYVMKYLKKVHPVCRNGLPKDIREKYQIARSEILHTEHLTANELAYKIESVLSLLGDGHTAAQAIIRNDDKRYLKDYQSWVNRGYHIAMLNGMTIEEMLEKYSDHYSYETEITERVSLERDLCLLNKLDYLGFDTDTGIQYTYENPDGDRHEVTYDTADFIPYEEYTKLNDLEDNANEDFVHYEIEEEKSRAVLTLSSCNYNDQYKNVLSKMFADVKNKEIKNIVVDLRENGGGSSFVAYEFIRYLDTASYKVPTSERRFGPFAFRFDRGVRANKVYEDALFHGNVSIVTSAYTFSSAMEFAQIIKDNELGVIIGEASGEKTDTCGECAEFVTPHAGIYFQISSAKFFRADRECKDELVTPDIKCNSDEALSYIP